MRLVIENEAGTRTVVPFSSDEIVIGRATEGVGWRLPDRNVSRRHARFVRANGTVFIEDLGSLTGTRLNGERIDSRRRVRPGDLVEIGAFDLVVLAEDHDVSGPGTPPPLPPITRPDLVAVAGPLATPAQAQVRATTTSAAVGTVAAGSVGGPGPSRRTRLVGLGVAALVGGLLAGALLRRLLT
jgi:pSer/pThr/pTyr-binding forkhead associated (FHA) protein